MIQYQTNLKLSFIFPRRNTDTSTHPPQKKGLTAHKAMEGYKTKQRELVLSYLKESDRCMSAEEIIGGLKTSGHTVSKTTVYRCLELFLREGQASKFISAQGESAVYRYSGGHDSHFHLKCTVCGRTECADCGFINRMQEHFRDHHGFTVSKTHTVIYGICRECSATDTEEGTI